MRLMLALAALALATAASAQTTWFVDINGTPPSTGKVSEPHPTIAYSVTQSTTFSGETALVSPGTDPERVVRGHGIPHLVN